MKVINTRDLHENTAQHILDVHQNDEAIFVTHHGRFVALLLPVDDKEIVERGLQAMVEQGRIVFPDAEGRDIDGLLD